MNQGTGQAQSNPLREGIVTRSVPDACTVVIFGATGDLTHRKLVPALYNIRGGWRAAAARGGDGLGAADEDGRRIPHGDGGSGAEVFAPDGAR